MWGDDPERIEAEVKSDIPEGLPLSTWLVYLGLLLFAILGILYWQYGGMLYAEPAYVAPRGAVFQDVTQCTFNDNLSCAGSVFVGDSVLLRLHNANSFDIREGTLSLSSTTGSCVFDGAQSSGVLLAFGTRTYNFTCIEETSLSKTNSLNVGIAFEYSQQGAPLTKYARGTLQRSQVIVE